MFSLKFIFKKTSIKLNLIKGISNLINLVELESIH
ncbi:hypothetical protein HK44_029535 (plasmid) [Pseudomonas fluorescens HK44]|uniref:Uncharacterized protein n=1 Tax=Pseudomonas fluorescens HK44 TaxID=1042209 RepID=A0A010SIC1_PSEFL|nr:hypothetical protein HK44_029535 [Pseudomonas fluorescens HK44]